MKLAAKSKQDKMLMCWALYSFLGLVLLVFLYYLGISTLWVYELQQLMMGAPMYLPEDAAMLSPIAGFILTIILTCSLTGALLMMHTIWRRLGILLWFLILLACAVPVLSLWGVFYNALSPMISCTFAGMLVLIFPVKK